MMCAARPTGRCARMPRVGTYVRLALLLLAGIAAAVALIGAANGWLGAFPWSNPPLAAFYVLIALFPATGRWRP